MLAEVTDKFASQLNKGERPMADSPLRAKGRAIRRMLMGEAYAAKLDKAVYTDPIMEKFAEQFETNMKVLVRFTESADQYVPYLLRKAEHIEDYLQK